MKTCIVESPERDRIEIKYDLNQSNVIIYEKKVFGCYELMQAIGPFLEKMAVGEVPSVPKGHVGYLLTELYLKIYQKWELPYSEAEICHCRVVPTETVCQAIRSGADTPAKVAQCTAASTACGSCLPDVESVLRYYKSASLSPT